YSFLALLTVLGETELLERAYGLEQGLNPEAFEEAGQELANILFDKISLVYSALENSALGYIWKIKLNETGKVPAFCNSLPELDHNEIVGFDNLTSSKKLKNDFHAIFLQTGDEHPRILRRIDLTKKLLESRSIPVSILASAGETKLEKTFNSIILADWTSFYIAKLNNVDPDRVDIVEELKRSL
ncbi:MAG: SIS domain-containing protein, partial [Patescibacteria group bacterium]